MKCRIRVLYVLLSLLTSFPAAMFSRQVVSRDRWLAARNTEERAREVGFECEVFLVVTWGFPKMAGFPNKAFLLFWGNHHSFWKHPYKAYTGS